MKNNSKFKKAWFNILLHIPFTKPYRSRMFYAKIGSSFINEINRNQNLRQYTVKNAPRLILILKHMGIKINR